MGLFDNLLYPGNRERALRAAQLSQDCADLSVTLVADQEKISTVLANANETIKKAYESLAQTTIPMTPVEIDPENWVADTAELILPLISLKVVNDALYAASRAWLLRQGRIGEAAFAKLIGLPKWMKVGKVMGGIAAAVGVELIIEAIDGAVQRDELQKAIHSAISPRITLKQKAMINSQVLIALLAVTAAYQAITGIPGMAFTKEQLDAIAQNLVNQHTVNINNITEEVARAELAKFDSDRKAWTDEDN